MPRERRVNRIVVDLPVLRLYLERRDPPTGYAVLVDACTWGEPGAIVLLEMAAELRRNVRTRRTAQAVHNAFQAGPPLPRWLTNMAESLLVLFRAMRRLCIPTLQGEQMQLPEVPRQLQRMLVSGGSVRENRVTLEQEASRTAAALWGDMAGRQCVIWMDNWYFERYTTEPLRDVQSQNVTAFAVLELDPVPLGRARTRGFQLPPFPGHVSLSLMVSRAGSVAEDCALAVRSLHSAVTILNAEPIHRDWLRVPLDFHRTAMQSTQWRPLMLSEYSVSANADLIQLLGNVRDVQAHCRLQTPLLVDENIHYRTCRLMYGDGSMRWDVRGWLRSVPLLYGVWHAYKQTVTLVYRQFFPVFALVEQVGFPETGRQCTALRKVVYMEKVCAGLLLAAPLIMPLIRARLQSAVQGSQSQDEVDPYVITYEMD